MPKGAILHAHIDSMVDVIWLIRHATYQQNCYMQTCKQTDRITFRFFHQDPNEAQTGGQGLLEEPWISVPAAREAYGIEHRHQQHAFDQMLYEKMTMMPEIRQGCDAFPDEYIWDRFLETFVTASGLINHTPVFRAYMKEKLERLIDDGVLYIEERMVGIASELYEADGTVHPLSFTIRTYRDIVREVVRKHSNSFVGAKIIYSGLKGADAGGLDHDLTNVLTLKKTFPETIAG